MKKKALLVFFLLILMTAAISATGTKEPKSFPNQTITINIPFGVGGNLDLKARLIAKYLKEDLGVPIVVENSPGAAGIIGTTEFLVKQPSGYQMVLLNDGALILAGLVSKATFTPLDIDPIIGMDVEYNILLANAEKTGITDFKSLVDYGKKNGLIFTSQGPSTVHFIAQKTLYNELGIKSENLMSNSQQEMLAKVLGGHADVAIVSQSLATSYVEAKKMVAIASFGDSAIKDYAGGKDVPSIVDLGYDVSFEAFNFFAYKAGASKEEKEIMYTAMAKVFENSDFQKEFAKLSTDPMPLNGDEVRAKIDSAYSKTSTMLKNL